MAPWAWILCFAGFTVNNLIWYWVGKEAGETAHLERDPEDSR
jgi:membrane protein DedA with SNARE-associated domain